MKKAGILSFFLNTLAILQPHSFTSGWGVVVACDLLMYF